MDPMPKERTYREVIHYAIISAIARPECFGYCAASGSWESLG